MRSAFPPYACYISRVSYPVVGAQTANERSRGLPLAGEVMRWLFTGKGMLTYSPSIVAASAKVSEESATPTRESPSRPAASRGPDRRTRGNVVPQRRRLADAAIVARRVARHELELPTTAEARHGARQHLQYRSR
jgi:hypothetical protein